MPARTLAQADWADKQFVLNNVRENGLILQFAAPSLRADKEVVMAAVQQDGLALHYAVKLPADQLQTNTSLPGAAKPLRADKEVVMAAVQQTGRALRYAAESLRADRDVVMAAVRHTGRALRYAAEHLRADKKVVLAAVQQSGRALEHAAESLRADKDVVTLASKAGFGLAPTHVADPSTGAALSVAVDERRDAKRELHKRRTGMPCASGWPVQLTSAPTYAIVLGVKERSVVAARPVATQPRAAPQPAKAIPLPALAAANLLSDDDELLALRMLQKSDCSSGGDSNRGSSSGSEPVLSLHVPAKRKAAEAGTVHAPPSKHGSPVAAQAI